MSTVTQVQKVSLKLSPGIAVLSLWLLSGCALNSGMQSNESKRYGGGDSAAFAQTVWPIVKENCASCHGVNQSPMFAQEDEQASYQAALAAVNLSNPAISRMVTQVGQNQHNCWGDCGINAQDLRAAIEAWANRIGPRPPEAARVELVAQTIPTTLPNQFTTPAANQWVTLTFPLDSVGITGGTFTIEIQEMLLAGPPAAPASENYRVRNPRLAGLTAPVIIEDLRLEIDDTYRTNEADYTVINLTVPAPGALLFGTAQAPHEMMIVKSRGLGIDQIKPTFKVLELQ